MRSLQLSLLDKEKGWGCLSAVKLLVTMEPSSNCCHPQVMGMSRATPLG